jgi:hypothetical protein
MTITLFSQTFVNQSFESSDDSWGPITLSNDHCTSGNGVWDFTSNLNGMSSTDGNQFWGIRDITDGCGIRNNANIALPNVLVSSFSDVSFTFDYFAKDFDKNEHLNYELFFDDISQGTVIIVDGQKGNSDNTNGWKSETVAIPNSVTYVRVIFSIELKKGNGEIAGFDNIRLTGKSTIPTCEFSTTWDNGIWSNGAPNANTTAIMNSDYDSKLWGSLEACNLQISNGIEVNINSNDFLKVNNDLTVDGTLEILNNGSLLMVNDLGKVSVTGKINVHKSSTPIKKYDYIYWSSPTEDETIGNALSTSVSSRIYEFNTSVYDNNNSGWRAVNGMTKMKPGIGYIAMAPISGTFPQTQSVTFEGIVNNGFIQAPIALSADNKDKVDDWNLIGNPYPSAIDADLLLNDPLNKNVVGGTVYIWTRNTQLDETKESNKYTSDDYATYTAGTGGVAAVSGGAKPSGTIASGQSFFIEANTTGNITFNNSMRAHHNLDSQQFFKEPLSKTVKSKKDRIWLNLSNNHGAFNQLLVGFIEGASDDIDNYDGLKFGGGYVSFYSIIEEQNFAVNGRANLTQNEIIKLGFSSYLEENDTLKISKASTEGKLNSGEFDIFLKDKLLNIVHDLNEKDYEFVINEQGIFDDRFELIINKTIVENIVNETTVNNELKIINMNDELIISTVNNDIISNIKAFDYLGKLIIDNAPQKDRYILNKEFINNGTVLLINAELENNEKLTKKLILIK